MSTITLGPHEQEAARKLLLAIDAYVEATGHVCGVETKRKALIDAVVASFLPNVEFARESALNPNKYGVRVECPICHHTKKPVGRSAPPELYLCDDDCKGYRLPPLAGSLWGNESEADFGYPVADAGTEIREAQS